MQTTTRAAGEHLAAALTSKDHDAIRAVLADDVGFRALTPSRFWEGASVDEVLEVLDKWFEPQDEVLGMQVVEADDFRGLGRVVYRCDMRYPDDEAAIEQLAYYKLDPDTGRVTYLRIICSGPR